MDIHIRVMPQSRCQQYFFFNFDYISFFSRTSSSRRVSSFHEGEKRQPDDHLHPDAVPSFSLHVHVRFSLKMIRNPRQIFFRINCGPGTESRCLFKIIAIRSGWHLETKASLALEKL